MKLNIIKTNNINSSINEEKQKDSKGITTVVIKTEPVEVGKEAIFKDAEEQHQKAEKEIAKEMKPADEIVKDVTTDTASEQSKVTVAKQLVKDRKELSKLIKEAKENKKVFKVLKSTNENYRYEVLLKDDLHCYSSITLNEGAEGKKVEGYKWVIYCSDENDPKYDTIVAVRSTYIEAHYYWMQHIDKDLGVELVKEEDAVVGKNMADIKEDLKAPKVNTNTDILPAVKIETPVVTDNEIDQTPVDQTPVKTTELDSTNKKEPTEEQKQRAIENMISGLITNTFSNIDSLKSVIASLEFEGKYDDVIAILNNITDSNTINIGMLQKALTIVSPQIETNMNTGTKEAEKVIDTVQE
jgi:hypothetical protein